LKKKNNIIKGSFTPFDKNIFWIAFCIIIAFILLYKIISPDSSITDDEYPKTIIACIAFIGISFFAYWRASDRYYFYAFDQNKILVQNILKKYERNFFYNKIIKIKLIGNIEFPILYKNTIHVIYNEDDVQKLYVYQSIQLETKDWIELITALRTKDIVCEDVNNTFFDGSDFK